MWSNKDKKKKQNKDLKSFWGLDDNESEQVEEGKYDIWNFEYTYNNLPTHSWYYGMALLAAPTFANHFWNKGGWIQNRANTLTFWCMFAQVFPRFQDYSVFSVIPSVYADGFANKNIHPVKADPSAQGFFAFLSIVSNASSKILF